VGIKLTTLLGDKNMPKSFWSDEEFAFVRSNFAAMTHQDMADKIGKTRDAVKKKCRELGLIKKPHAEWNESNLKFFRENWDSMTYQEIGDKLGMSEKMVFLQAERDGLSKEITVNIGDTFNRLTVKALPVSKNIGKQTKNYVLCECECKNMREVKLGDLVSGRTISCGCYQKEVASKWMKELKTTHNSSYTKLYKNWVAAKSIAFHDNLEFYSKWFDFLTFKDWADNNHYEENNTRLYRKDTSIGYNPDNCVFRRINHAG